MDHLHRSILKRIFWAWLFISVGSLIFIFLIGIRRFDSVATRMAFAEADRVLFPGTEGIHPREAHIQQSLGEIRGRIPSEVCRLRFYDLQGLLTEEIDGPAIQKAGMAMGAGFKELPRDGRLHLNHFDFAEETFLQWMVPVRNAGPTKVGFIEGVVLLSEHDVWILRTSIKVVAMAVLLSITVTALALYPLMLSLNRRLYHFANEVAGGQIEILSVLSSAIAQRDSDTSDHNFRVTLYAIRLAEALGTGGLDMRALILGSLLHDVGKIGVRDDILLKPGPLTEQEILAMRSHVQKGLEIVSSSRWLRPSRDVIHYHHEHCDGSGYPQGMMGESIPLQARLFAIVDVFDALTSPRPYKESWPVDIAIEYIEERAGTQFDSPMVQVFRQTARKAHAETHEKSGAELLAILMLAAEPYHQLFPHTKFPEQRWKSRPRTQESGPLGARTPDLDG